MNSRTFIVLFLVANGNAQTVPGSTPAARPGKVDKLKIDVSAVSNTQAILAYTAPHPGSCRVDVSESASYSPPVHDVDAALFPGANLDSRFREITGAATRIFVVGSRLPAIANDNKIYSRALQAYTLHYGRVTCGASLGEFTFTTTTIPVGSTYNEPPPAVIPNASNPLGWMIPTLDGARTQEIVDPQTGALLSPFSLQSDRRGSTGITIYTGAPPRACNSRLHTDPNGLHGYLCNLDDQVGFRALYFFVPATGEARYLGIVRMPNTIVDDNLNAYTGDSSQESPSTASVTIGLGIKSFGSGDSSPLTAGLRARAHSRSNPLNFMEGKIISYKCAQGCAIVIDVEATGGSGTHNDWDILGTGNIFKYTYAGKFAAACAACDAAFSAPTIVMAPPTGTLMRNFDPTFDATRFGCFPVYAGAGQYAPVICKSGAQDSSGVIGSFYGGDGRPAPISCAAGDAECPRVTAVWNIPADPITKYCGIHSTAMLPGTTLLAVNWHVVTDAAGPCNVSAGEDGVWGITYFDLKTGAPSVVDTKFPGGGHNDTGPLGRVSEAGAGYGFVPTNGRPMIESIGQPLHIIESTAAFNGVAPPGYGNLLTKHPSYQQTTNDPWFLDRVAFGGGSAGSGTGRYYSADLGAVHISGQLYQYFSDPRFPLQRKSIPTQATSGGYSLRDISEPRSVISDTPRDNYAYCVVVADGECRAGSKAGDVFFNVPELQWPFCTGGDPNPANLDVCITNMPAYSSTLMQWYMGVDSADSRRRSRNLTGGLVGPKSIFVYPLAKAVADGSYALFTKGVVLNNVGAIDVWKVKIPPLPAPDGVDRTGYVPFPVSITSPPDATDNAIVKFWYAEYGTYCGSRAESCYAAATSVPSGDNPYLYPSDGSAGTLATVRGLSCIAGCTVAVPGITGHVLYYQAEFRDASNTIISSAAVNVTLIP